MKNDWFTAQNTVSNKLVGTTNLKVVGAADLRKRMIAQGAQLQGSTPAELAAIVKSDVAKWTKVIRDAGVKLEQ